LILRQWLQAAGVIPDVEIRLVAIPPDQLFPTLKLGYIDGFCAGEPWISLVTGAGIGQCVAGSREIAPQHPGKVLMVRQSFAAGREEEHERLLAALLEACAACNQPENRRLLGQMLSPLEYVNAPAEFVETGFPSLVDSGVPGEPLRTNIFFGGDINEPSDAKSQWIINRLYEALGKSMDKLSVQGRSPILKNIFRTDIFSRAKGLSGNPKDGTEWKSEHKAMAG
jgi:ABC-type nitrate/sulfonate/bicarbonate transport system substrate-binding protein